MIRMRRRVVRGLLGLALAAVAVVNSGCLAAVAGAAAAGAGGVMYYMANVKETYDTDIAVAMRAADYALSDLGMPIVAVSPIAPESVSASIESRTGTQDKVMVYFDQDGPKIPTDPAKTTIGVRVATFGDEETSRRILSQIAARLPAARSSVNAAAARPTGTPQAPAAQPVSKTPAAPATGSGVTPAGWTPAK